MNAWNKGQAEAIDAFGTNVLVSASAGAGKTAVLVERLIRRLTDPRAPLAMDRFLFVTFTNAAAREMNRRVRRGIEEKVRQAPGNRLLHRQQQMLGEAAISTLHGFCLDLIRRRYESLGIDPQSRVLSEPEQMLLQGEVLDAWLEECYEANTPGFAALVSVYGGDRSDDPLKELVLRVFHFAEAQPYPMTWLYDSVDLYRNEDGPEKLLPFLLMQTAESLEALARSLDKGIAMSARLPALKKYGECLQADRDAIGRLAAAKDWAALVASLEAGKGLFGRLPVIRQRIGTDEVPTDYMLRMALQPKVKAIRESCKKAFGKLATALAGETLQNLKAEISRMAPAMTELASLVTGFYQHYQTAKIEKSVLDFGDIEHFALSLLVDEVGAATAQANDLRERYDEILVDEYQDINPVQETILQALRGKSLYMVGDVKQSIYGFRQAAPRLFLEKFHSYGSGGDGTLVFLDESYRSSQWVAQGINQVFDDCMTEETAGLDYRGTGRLSCAEPFPDEAMPLADAERGYGALELHLIHTGEDPYAARTFADEENTDKMYTEETYGDDVYGHDAFGDDLFGDDLFEDDAWGEDPYAENLFGDNAYGDHVYTDGPPEGHAGTLPAPGNLQAEAAFCARRIEDLTHEELWDRREERRRPVRYRDVVILLPAMKGVADNFVEALRGRNIPVFADIGGGYFRAQEIQIALSFLKVLDNPRQDIPLAALMLSPAIGFTPEALGRIKADYPGADAGRHTKQDAGETDTRVTGQAAGEKPARIGGRGGKWGGLYKALLYAASRKASEQNRDIRAFLKMLKDFRLLARQSSVADVLLRFYEETGFLVMSSAMSGGAQRKANLLALVQKAQEYEQTNLRGLYSFIQYLEAMDKRGTDLAPAPVVGEGEDVVRIMSIHKSKGLEFPIVILATAGRRFNRAGNSTDPLLHERLGMAGRITLPDRRVRYAGAYHRLIAFHLEKEMAAERQRLLYVALTRAEQRLIVLSADRQAEKRYRAWLEEKDDAQTGGPVIHDVDLTEANSFMDWLGPAVIRYSEPSPWVSRLWKAEESRQEESTTVEQADKESRRESTATGEDWPLFATIPTAEDTAGIDSAWSFIGRQLEWTYPWKEAGARSAKLSVTQARGRLYPEEDTEAADADWKGELYRPRLEGPRYLRGDQNLSPAEKGTLLHRILARVQPAQAKAAIEALSMGRPPQVAAKLYLETLLDRLTAGLFLSPAEKEAVESDMLADFLCSAIFSRMARADALGLCRREASFTMAVPAWRLYATQGERQAAEDTASDDQVVVQGIIDVYFYEGEHLVLVDYKSDRIRPGEEEELLRRYGGQLRLYAEGLERFSGRRVSEMLLYSLPIGKAIPLL